MEPNEAATAIAAAAEYRCWCAAAVASAAVVEVVAAAVQPGSDAVVTRTDSAARARVCCCCCYYYCRRRRRRHRRLRRYRRRRTTVASVFVPFVLVLACPSARGSTAYNVKTLLSKSSPRGHVRIGRRFPYAANFCRVVYHCSAIIFPAVVLSRRTSSFWPALVRAGNVE